MDNIKIIIDIKDATIQAVYSNVPLEYVIVDHDYLKNNNPLLQSPQKPNVIHAFLYQLYDSDTVYGLEIREVLKRLKF